MIIIMIKEKIFQILIAFPLFFDRLNYYFFNKAHIGEFIFNRRLERGNVFIYFYDSYLVAGSLYGTFKMNSNSLTMIGLIIDVTLKLWAIKLNGLELISNEFNSSIEGFIFITLMTLILLTMNYIFGNNAKITIHIH